MRTSQEDVIAVVEHGGIYLGDEYINLESGVFPASQTLYLICDGMGGMGHGDIAAKCSSEAFIESFLNLRLKDEPVKDALRKSLDMANDVIAEQVRKNPDKEGMGSTLVAALWDALDESIQWISVGDSLLYLLRKGKLRQLNESHTIGAMRAESQYLINEEGKGPRIRTTNPRALVSAVSGSPMPYVDLSEPMKISESDILMFASDGLETLAHSKIEKLLCEISADVKVVSSWQESKHIIARGRKRIVSAIAAHNAPKQDNASIILVGYFKAKKYKKL
jgi:serine/threonine protein phosphatase PrpC